MSKLTKPKHTRQTKPKHTAKRLASWRAARQGLKRSYRVWQPHVLIAHYVETGVLTEAEAADPDRVAEALAAAARVAVPQRIIEELAEHDEAKNKSP
jgi:hypothetical protein